VGTSTTMAHEQSIGCAGGVEITGPFVLALGQFREEEDRFPGEQCEENLARL
jgi:hypothetical protein